VLVLAAWPWGAYLGEEALEEGVDVMVSSWRKHASSQVPTNVKTTGLYVNSMLAGEEARRNGYVEAIVLNKEGNVAEGPGENIFMVNDGGSTPPVPHSRSSKGSPATPSSNWRRSAATPSTTRRSSPADSCTPPTSCSSPAPPSR